MRRWSEAKSSLVPVLQERSVIAALPGTVTEVKGRCLVLVDTSEGVQRWHVEQVRPQGSPTVVKKEVSRTTAEQASEAGPLLTLRNAVNKQPSRASQ